MNGPIIDLHMFMKLDSMQLLNFFAGKSAQNAGHRVQESTSDVKAWHKYGRTSNLN